MVLIWLLACSGSEPVVSGVPDTPEEVRTAREAKERRADPAEKAAVYQKAEGVYIDARYLGGRSYSAVRDELEAQLGAVTGEEDLGEDGKEIQFERGSLRVLNNEIYMLAIPLPEPLRRTEALGVLGFPATNQKYITTNTEFRLTNAWGFRRIRFFRVERDSEDIERVEIWKTTPKDQ